MPRKSKKRSSLLDTSARKTGRGRPRKTVSSEALLPFGTGDSETVKYDTNIQKTCKKNPKNSRTNPATSDKDYTADEVEFMNALAEFKRTSGRLFPTCSEILYVLRELGYKKVGREKVEV